MVVRLYGCTVVRLYGGGMKSILNHTECNPIE